MKNKIGILFYSMIVLGVSFMLTFSCTKEDKPVAAGLSTSAISAITQTSATGGGEVTSDGGSAVTARGVCWNSTGEPTTANSKTTDGSGTGSFTSSMTGLTAGTTYYVRAYAINSVGTSYGDGKNFTTDAVLPPALTTDEASNITKNSALSGGNISSDGGGAVTVRGVCWSTTTNPNISLTTKTSEGSGTGAFSSSITGLTPNTLYYVRSYATNSAGTTYGNEISFTTTPDKATLTTTAIGTIALTTASSGGNITSDGGATVSARGICWSTSINPTVALSTKTTDGIGTGSYTSSITGLTKGTTYYVRAYATNSAGTAYGNELSFTTISISVPTLTTSAITLIKATTASSGGNITDDGGAAITARGICWSTSTGPTAALITKTTDGSGMGAFTSSMTGLTANYTTYYVRAYATNSAGTAYGNEVMFMTDVLVLPTLTTATVTAITTTTATTGGNITADGGASVTARGVCWSVTANPTVDLTTKSSDGTGTGQFVSLVTGLTANTTYYIRAYATNSEGTAYGDQSSFTTLPTIPTVTTTAISVITQNSASSGGNISYSGGASILARGVCWSTSQFPTVESNGFTLNGTGTGTFTSSLTSLTSNTTYYVRAYATNSVGTAYGDQLTFKTLGLPTLTTTAATSITATTATGGGNITNDGGTTVTVSGVCWSLTTGPTTSDSKTTDGSATGSFSTGITGLTQNRIYYVRAYATNSIGTAYGSEIWLITIPAPSTTAITLINSTSASSGGNIGQGTGSASVTARGVCWSTSPNPTISNDTTSNGTGNGSYSSRIKNLTLGITYYVRAYATNSSGTGYGSQVSFTTETGIGDSFQGGIIAYYFLPGDPGYVGGEKHGLIAAPSNQSAGTSWGANGTTGATATSVGSGQANTTTIVAYYAGAGSAAKLCDDLDLNGYTDWYMPSLYELDKLYQNREAIGTIFGTYWSSSEFWFDHAWRENLVNGVSDYLTGLRTNTHAVRAFRTF